MDLLLLLALSLLVVPSHLVVLWVPQLLEHPYFQPNLVLLEALLGQSLLEDLLPLWLLEVLWARLALQHLVHRDVPYFL